MGDVKTEVFTDEFSDEDVKEDDGTDVEDGRGNGVVNVTEVGDEDKAVVPSVTDSVLANGLDVNVGV